MSQVWTALPHGRTRDATRKLQLSVLVTPRLEGGAPTLDGYPLWRRWPPPDLGFTVVFDTGRPAPATVVWAEGTPDRKLWRSLFPLDTPVETFVAKDLSDRTIFSYPARAIRAHLVHRYSTIVTTKTRSFLPNLSALLTDDCLGPVAFLHRSEEQTVEDEIRTLMAPTGTFPVRQFSPDNFATDLYQVRLFHQPRHQTPDGEPPPDIPPPTYDFNDCVGMLSAYPALVKRLGLVVELQLADAIPPGATRLKVIPHSASLDPEATEACPWTRFLADSFRAAPRAVDADVADGYLRLDDGTYDIVEFDVDAAGDRVLHSATTLRSVIASLGDTNRKPVAGAPPFRTAGLALVREGRASRLAQRFGVQRTVNQNLALGQQVVFDAEDVVRGVRVDVAEGTGPWRSLCGRTITLTLRDGTTVELDPDECYVSAAVTGRSDGQGRALFASETLWRWTGWSLAAPRPGKVLGDDDEVVDEPAPDQDNPMGLGARPEPHGLLPRLRYGKSYRFRARTVDLAGNGISLAGAAAEATHASVARRFLRFEQIPHPVVLSRRPATIAETARRMVVRSEYTGASGARTERHVLPPSTSVQQAEWAGKLDKPTGEMDPATYAVLATRSGVTQPPGGVADPAVTGELYYDTPRIPTPWLPDPFAAGAAFNGLGDVAPIAFDPPSGGAWYEAQGFRVVLLGRDQPPAWDAENRVFTVGLAPGRTVDVDVSCSLPSGTLSKLGQYQWLHEADLFHYREDLRALAGQNWMLTPATTLTLVHAVRQPLAVPEFDAFAVAPRTTGDTAITCQGNLVVDRKSTGRVDVFATWTEPVDALGENAPADLRRSVKLFHLDVPYNELAVDALALAGRKYEWGDTRHRKITVSTVATTRYTAEFVETRPVQLKGGTPVRFESRGIAAVHAVTAPDRSVSYDDSQYVVDLAAGTIAWKRSPGPSTVLVRYLPKPVTRDSDDPDAPGSAKVTVDVLSTARPSAPVIRYVVPTFGFTDWASARGGVRRTRTSGLRVYLERPWFSSGDGEKLAVICSPSDDVSELHAPIVSRIGRDPAFQSKAAPVLRRTLLPRTVSAPGNLTLPNTPLMVFEVAPHDVAFDAARMLWYCDIDVAVGPTYTPFVVLTLARYQEHAISASALSAPVQAEIMQLTPTRTAFIGSSTGASVPVSVSGLLHESGGGLTRMPNVVVITVEEETPGLAGDVRWRRVSDTELPAPVLDGGLVATWNGTIALPANRGSRPFRLVFREYEDFSAPPQPEATRGAGTAASPSQRRLLYLEARVI